ncbi:MAG: hypothetical protein ACRECX_04000 [Methyloceanibacter sp.]|uniref:hypothetical protein n=1 Tax=Methyloceanibacter sp. TaxID=1965321 RepID=UPI003D6D02A0
MAVTLVNSFNVQDNATLELDGAFTVTTAVVGGTSLLFVGGVDDDGISVFSVSANGTLTNVANVADNATLELEGVASLTTAVVGGTTYLFAAGITDDGVSAFSVGATGALTNVANVTDDATLLLDGAISSAVATVGGTTYLFVAGVNDDGISTFSVGPTGALTNIAGGNETDVGALQLDGIRGLATAIVGSATYLFAAGSQDDGVSVFSVGASGALTNVENITDGLDHQLEGAQALATASVGGTTYLFVGGADDSGISVFAVGVNGGLTNVFNITDDDTLNLNFVSSLITARIAGTTYLFAAGQFDGGVSVFAVADDGSLINFANVSDGGALELAGAASVTTAVIGGATYLFVAGNTDDGVSVFRIDTTGLTINGTGGNDVIDALNSAPGELLPSDLGDTINGLGGNDNIDGLAGNDVLLGSGGNDILRGGEGDDVLTGGAGRDLVYGDAGRDRFDFNKISESKPGGQRDKVMHFQRGQDDIDLRTIDAKTGVSGNNKFKFIGTQDFHDVKGELRYEDRGSTVIVQGDRNGDGTADFEIFVAVGSLSKGDFLL